LPWKASSWLITAFAKGKGMITRRHFTADVANRAVRLAARVWRSGLPGPARGVVRPIRLTWRHRVQGLFAASQGGAQMGISARRERRLALIQHQIGNHGVWVTGRPGPAGKAGADGRVLPGQGHDKPRRRVATAIVRSTAQADIPHRRGHDASLPRPASSRQPDASVNPIRPRLVSTRWRMLPGSDGRPRSQDSNVGAHRALRHPSRFGRSSSLTVTFHTPGRGPDGMMTAGRHRSLVGRINDQPQLADSVRTPSLAMAFHGPTRGSDRVSAASGHRVMAGRVNGVPQRAVLGQSGGISPDAQAFAPQGPDLAWRKTERPAMATLATSAVRPGGPLRLQEAGQADAPGLRRADAPAATPDARDMFQKGPRQAAVPARFDSADLARLTDEVIRHIDKRARIARERAGR